jgi:ubiquinone/menaquinone biosynthesis C-methylase UbiE
VSVSELAAESYAAHLLPHLRPGMTLLDLGCGDGAITAELAAAVAPGPAIGLDLQPSRPQTATARIVLVTADARELPLQDASVDAVHVRLVLQHLRDPTAALREARRVARPGAVVAVHDVDWDGELVFPTSPLIKRSREIMRLLRRETSPFVGKRLRTYLTDAGFDRCEARARSVSFGTPAAVREFAGRSATWIASPAVDRAVDAGWTTPEERTAIAKTWQAWGEEPGAFVARVRCEALAWVDDASGDSSERADDTAD